MFTEPWDKVEKEITLPHISVDVFEIIREWMSSSKLPARIGQTMRELEPPTADKNLVLETLRAAEFLLIDQIQNDIIAEEAASLLEENLTFKAKSLRDIYNADLSHTKYYQFVLKAVAFELMTAPEPLEDKWTKDLGKLKEHPTILIDLVLKAREWALKPWEDPAEGNLSEFFVEIPGERSGTPMSHGGEISAIGSHIPTRQQPHTFLYNSR